MVLVRTAMTTLLARSQRPAGGKIEVARGLCCEPASGLQTFID
jgi:hypothetical protein